MDPMNIFMLICVGIIVLLAIIYCINDLTNGLINRLTCCFLGCHKHNTGYTVVELGNVINNLPPPVYKDNIELL